MLFRCSQHDSAVARNLLFVLLLPLFLFLSFPLSVSASSLSFDSEMVKMVERGRERACETNEQQPLRGSCYPRSIGVYSTGVPLPTRFYLPDIYIYVYMYIVYFRRCFAFVFRRTMKETLRTICSLYIFLVQRKRKEFSFARMGEPPRELFARKHDGGVE